MIIHTCDIPPDKKLCVNCNRLLLQPDIFCGNCGTSQEKVTPPNVVSNSLWSALGYYFSVLALIFVLVRLSITEFLVDNTLISDLLFIGLTLIFAAFNFKKLVPNLLKPVYIKPALAVIAIMAAFAVLISAAIYNIPALNDETYNYYIDYAFTSHPLLYMILSIGVVPGIFEELAFRGFVYNNLKNIMTERTTMWVTTFLFTILHLSPISFLFIIPIGYFFAYLRMRTGHIWYGVIGHFTYNSIICLIDYYYYFN